MARGLSNARRHRQQPPPSSLAPAPAAFNDADVADEMRRIREQQRDITQALASTCLDPDAPLPGDAAKLGDDPLARLLTGLVLTERIDPSADPTTKRIDDVLTLIRRRLDLIDVVIRDAAGAKVPDPFRCGHPVGDATTLLTLRQILMTAFITGEDAKDGYSRTIHDLIGDREDDLVDDLILWATCEAANERTLGLIRNGKVPLARRIAREHGHHDPDLTVHDEETIAKLVAAAHMLGHMPNCLRMLGDRSFLCREFAYATEPARLDITPGLEPPKGPDMAAAHDADEAITHLHAVLRAPQRFLQRPERPANHRIAVRIDVTNEAFRELYERLNGSPAWRGHHVHAIEMGRPRVAGEMKYGVGVGAELAVASAGEIVTIEFATLLEGREHWGSDTVMEAARSLYGDKFAAELRPLDMIVRGDVARWRPIKGTKQEQSAPPVHEAI